MNRKTLAITVLFAATPTAFGESFNWTVDSNTSILTTTISATLGSTLSDTETNKVSGFLAGDLALPAYTFGSVHLTATDLSYTTNPTFSLTQPFVGGVNIVGSGLGFAIPGPNNLGFVSPTPANVGLDGSFSQTGNGAEGRGTLTYTGVGILGASIGTGTINLLDQSPLPLDFNGTIVQSGNQLTVTLPISIDQTTVQNGIPVRVQISGNVYAQATTTANGWKADVDGSWGVQSNWVANTGIPGTTGSPFDTAVFGDFGANSTRTIAVTGPVYPRRVLVSAGTTGKYVFDGMQPISLRANANGSASLSVLSGEGHFRSPVDLPLTSTAHVETGATLTLSSVTAVLPSTLTKTGGGALHIGSANLGTVNVDAGTVAFTGPLAARVTSLAVGAAGSVAVADTLLVENQAGGIARLTAYLQTSVAAGAPGGIVQPATGRLGLGTRASTGLATYGGFTLSNSTLVVRATVVGDTNLDRVVDFDDLLSLAQKYGGSGFWFEGDFNYDGAVNFDDLLGLAQNYGVSLRADERAQLSAEFARDFALAQSLVPEPMMLAALPMLGLRRRRCY